MKIAVINFSGNVGKTLVARHLLRPRMPGAELVAVESVNAGTTDGTAMKGNQFGQLQEYLQTLEHAIVDIGASNLEDLLALMHRYRNSHEDFDFFLVPTVPARKQQQDTLSTLAELHRLGVAPDRIRVVFNMVEPGADVQEAFATLFRFLKELPVAQANPACRIEVNEVFERVKTADAELTALADDPTDYKALIARATDINDKLALASRLATRRLAQGTVPELDACFAALGLMDDQRALEIEP